MVPGPSVFPSRETGVWGTFGGCMKGVRYHFALQAIPLLCLKGFPDLSSAPKDEAGLRRKFET